MEIVTILAGVGTAIAAANGSSTLLNNIASVMKRLREKKSKDPETQAALVELTAQLSEAIVENANVKGELATLQSRLVELKRSTDLLALRETREGMYYLKSPPAGFDEGPYCTGCWNVNDKVVRLLFDATCPACKVHHKPPDLSGFVEANEHVARSGRGYIF